MATVTSEDKRQAFITQFVHPTKARISCTFNVLTALAITINELNHKVEIVKAVLKQLKKLLPKAIEVDNGKLMVFFGYLK